MTNEKRRQQLAACYRLLFRCDLVGTPMAGDQVVDPEKCVTTPVSEVLGRTEAGAAEDADSKGQSSPYLITDCIGQKGVP